MAKGEPLILTSRSGQIPGGGAPSAPGGGGTRSNQRSVTEDCPSLSRLFPRLSQGGFGLKNINFVSQPGLMKALGDNGGSCDSAARGWKGEPMKCPQGIIASCFLEDSRAVKQLLLCKIQEKLER